MAGAGNFRYDNPFDDGVSVSSRTGSISVSGNVRVYVQLPTGSKILVPISPTASMARLHQEAIRRAAGIGVSMSTENTVLSTTGPSPAVAFAEDLLEDVLDATNDQTFTLSSLDLLRSLPNRARAPSSSPSSIRSSFRSSITPSLSASASHYRTSSINSGRDSSSEIYIRWITPRQAIEKTRLKHVAMDPNSIPSNTSLMELQRLAMERLYPANVIAEEGITTMAKPQLYTRHCYLSTTSRPGITLSDVGLTGSRKEPLEIFVAMVGPLEDVKKTSSEPQLTWGFRSTDRGVATFSTSLAIMIKEITNGHVNLGTILEILWELTHFPPAVLAFRELYEMTGTKPSCLSHAVLAQTFRDLSLKMIPPWISNSPDSVLEASRQIFSWLHSLPSASSTPSDSPQKMIYSLWLKEMDTESDQSQSTGVRIDVPIVDTQANRTSKQVFATFDSASNIDLSSVAISLFGAYNTAFSNFYFSCGSDPVQILEHKRMPALHPADFDNVLHTTNQVDAFRMTAPLQLSATPSSAFPIITLNHEGYVSLYESFGNWSCDDGYFATFNPVSGKERMPEINPGQYLLQKLEPIITKRRKEGTWEVDAWTENDALTDTTTPEEAIVICTDISSSMAKPMATGWLGNESLVQENPGPTTQGPSGMRSFLRPSVASTNTQLSRLSEVKDVYKNLITRIAAYRLQTHVGLVTFSHKEAVRTNQALTAVLLNFRDQLNTVSAAGSTAMWDGINKSKDMLIAHKALHPTAKCRIIVLTDGQDNDSRAAPANMCQQLFDNDIVLDAVVIGTDTTDNLFRAAKHTGGYAFCPKTRAALYQIFLLETFIDIRMRPDIVKVPLRNGFSRSTPKAADMSDVYDFPPCRPHANQNDYFIALRDADRYLTNLSRRSSRVPRRPVPPSRTPSVSSQSQASTLSRTTTLGGSIMSGTTVGASGSTRVLLGEIKAMIDNQHDFIDVYVSENNMGFWKVVIQGPQNSPYENGTFLLYIELGDQFPRTAPMARFITPVLHPNVTKHGRICHPIFDREWTAHTHVYQVLQQIFAIFMSIESRDAIDPLFTLKFWTDPESGRREVQQYVQRFASRTRSTLRQDIVGATSSVASTTSLTQSTQSWHTASSFGRNPLGSALGSQSTGYLPRTSRLVPGFSSNDRNTTLTPTVPLDQTARANSSSSTASSQLGRRRSSFFRRIVSSQNLRGNASSQNSS